MQSLVIPSINFIYYFSPKQRKDGNYKGLRQTKEINYYFLQLRQF